MSFTHSLPAFDHPEYSNHSRWMREAIALAESAGKSGDVPVGAIVVGSDGTCLARAENRKERDHDPTAHAEILALRQAGQMLGSWHLEQCTLYVTLEPCPMCSGAIIQSRLGLLVYGADDFKAGTIRSVMNLPASACSNHQPKVIAGILEEPCRQQLQTWFAERRQPSRRNESSASINAAKWGQP